MAKRLLSLRVCVARSNHNHDNATRVAQHKAQYAKIVGASRLFYCLLRSKQLPRFCEILLAKFPFLFLFLFFCGKRRYENVYRPFQMRAWSCVTSYYSPLRGSHCRTLDTVNPAMGMMLCSFMLAFEKVY